MDMLSASEAASLLHLHPRRVQQLARAGRLPAARVGRKWLFRRSDLEGLLGTKLTAPTSTGVDLSARNQLRVRVLDLAVDGLMAELRLGIGDQEIVSVITRSSAERLKVRVGDELLAVIKATEVMIGRGAST
jgi:molybdopterin-binding protein